MGKGPCRAHPPVRGNRTNPSGNTRGGTIALKLDPYTGRKRWSSARRFVSTPNSAQDSSEIGQ